MENVEISAHGLQRLIRRLTSQYARPGPHPDPWIGFGPHTGTRAENFDGAALASSVISQLLARHDLAAMLDASGADEAAGRALDDVGDWVCGNDLRRVYLHYRWPFGPRWPVPPDPWPIDQGDPVDQVAFGSRMLQAASLVDNEALASAFARTGQRIVETGVKALETAS